MAKEYKLSAERLKELEEELTYLKTVKDKEVTEQIKVARGYGDLSENSEYDEAKNEQAKLYGRIAEVEEILANAVLINADEAGSDYIGLGCTFTVKDLEFDEESTFELVGSQEANPMKGRVSDDAPFGRALVGAKVGDIVKVEAPDGVIQYEVINISR
ncbi:MAG: transcription elongation factor GreA [Oscillospiraceae bacterium]|nr:transcription elongation factor GreA [Oscillospiraceae bacterium]